MHPIYFSGSHIIHPLLHCLFGLEVERNGAGLGGN